MKGVIFLFQLSDSLESYSASVPSLQRTSAFVSFSFFKFLIYYDFCRFHHVIDVARLPAFAIQFQWLTL